MEVSAAATAMGTISAATTAMSGTSRARRWTVFLIDVLLLTLDIGSASRPARRRASHGGRADEMREKAQSVLRSVLIGRGPWELQLVGAPRLGLERLGAVRAA